MTPDQISEQVALYEKKIAEYEEEVARNADLFGEVPVYDLSELLSDCPKPVLLAIMERQRANRPEEIERRRRMARDKNSQAVYADRLAAMLEEKGKDESAAGQRERAERLRAEAKELTGEDGRSRST